MEVFTSIPSLRFFLNQQRSNGKSIGLVPTMGALHQGHISLLDKANSENNISVCSIFVNPTQFNNPEDLAKYPRTLEADLDLLKAANCSVVFAPTAEEMYPESPVMTFNFGLLETVMEGASRPGHFNGVGIIVSKLFNIIQPDKAYFGQKDLQQVSVIKRLVTDLSFSLDLVICPTVREISGLAMSSRNQRLSEEEKATASHIYRILSFAKEKILGGGSIELARREAVDQFSAIPEFTMDYFEIVDLNTLLPLANLKPDGTNAICVAAFLGPVRLIDNVIF
ncbi:pantoate--beta-alanine ligase [Dyadobacter sp. CY312]|uniref:pantoate--beta-alanine ligase n=1 Tax=Dyadobacter sp. CY312 TaxID=2907303 RepID=UPI001F35BB43|nr:pantoate--beta-alanine ligase [Dyadobacter sp. CY312]MCE7041235.1 pantoate--beta-alanine ligase [Dyadobacter sp. CY312]